MHNEWLVVLFSFLLLPGVAASFFPGLPGLLYMFFAALIYGAVTSFATLTTTNLVILAVIVAVAMLVDLLSGIIAAKHGGANTKSIISGFVGLVLGTFLIPVPILGTFVGFFLGVFAGELIQHHSKHRAIRAATYGLVGTAIGTIVNVAMSFAFLICFIFFAIF